MTCMADYDEDCKGKKPKGCNCLNCCIEHNQRELNSTGDKELLKLMDVKEE